MTATCKAHIAQAHDYTCRACKTRVPAIPRTTRPALTPERKADLESLFA